MIVNLLGAKWTQARTEAAFAPKGEDAIEQARASMEQGVFFNIVLQIETRSDDIFITKTTWDAFYSTGLDEQLKKRGVTGIVLVCVATSIDIGGTARQASEYGYNITFAKDAMTDMNLSAHEHSLAIILKL